MNDRTATESAIARIPEMWTCTSIMRWHAELIQQPPRLQQMRKSTHGDKQWRDIPLHIGAVEHSVTSPS